MGRGRGEEGRAGEGWGGIERGGDWRGGDGRGGEGGEGWRTEEWGEVGRSGEGWGGVGRVGEGSGGNEHVKEEGGQVLFTTLTLSRCLTHSIQVYKKAVEHFPEHTQLLTVLGLLFLQMGDTQKAFEHLGQWPSFLLKI